VPGEETREVEGDTRWGPSTVPGSAGQNGLNRSQKFKRFKKVQTFLNFD
jgi:hypothetical protein